MLCVHDAILNDFSGFSRLKYFFIGNYLFAHYKAKSKTVKPTCNDEFNYHLCWTLDLQTAGAAYSPIICTATKSPAPEIKDEWPLLIITVKASLPQVPKQGLNQLKM